MQLLLNIVASLTFQLLWSREEAGVASRSNSRLLRSVTFAMILPISNSVFRQGVQGVILVFTVDPGAHVGFHLVLNRRAGVESRVVKTC
jgi:hypothetical protein